MKANTWKPIYYKIWRKRCPGRVKSAPSGSTVEPIDLHKPHKYFYIVVQKTPFTWEVLKKHKSVYECNIINTDGKLFHSVHDTTYNFKVLTKQEIFKYLL